MPFILRDFRCTKCDKTFEALTDDEQAPACPGCKDSEYVVRGISFAAGYQMNGSGGTSVTPRGSGSWKRRGE